MLQLVFEELPDRGARRASTGVLYRRFERAPVVLLLADSLLLSSDLGPTCGRSVWQCDGMRICPDHQSERDMNGCIEAALCHLACHMIVCVCGLLWPYVMVVQQGIRGGTVVCFSQLPSLGLKLLHDGQHVPGTCVAFAHCYYGSDSITNATRIVYPYSDSHK